MLYYTVVSGISGRFTVNKCNSIPEESSPESIVALTKEANVDCLTTSGEHCKVDVMGIGHCI